MAPNWEVTLGRRGLLVPGTLFIAYTSEGGPLKLFGDEIPPNYRVVDPRTGEVLREGALDPEMGARRQAEHVTGRVDSGRG